MNKSSLKRNRDILVGNEQSRTIEKKFKIGFINESKLNCEVNSKDNEENRFVILNKIKAVNEKIILKLYTDGALTGFCFFHDHLEY